MSNKRFPFFDFQHLTVGEANASLFNEILQHNNPSPHQELKEIFYTQKDLEAAKKAAYEEGVSHGEQQQKLSEEEFKNQVLKALNSLITKIEEIGNLKTHTHTQEFHRGCVELAFAIANKICDTDETTGKEQMILKFVNDNIQYLLDEPSVTIKLSAQIYSHIHEQIEQSCREHKFVGQLLFTIDSSLETYDCILEFNDTSIKKLKKEIINSVNDIYNKYVIANDSPTLENHKSQEE